MPNTIKTISLTDEQKAELNTLLRQLYYNHIKDPTVFPTKAVQNEKPAILRLQKGSTQ